MLREKLEILRRINRKLDLSKASTQLDILLLLANTPEGLTIHEISKILNKKYKSIADALRKMVSKKLVERNENNKYILTSEGILLYKILTSTLGVNKNSHKQDFKSKCRDDWRLIYDVITINHLYNVIMALGLTKDNTLDLETLSKIMGLHKRRAQSYLDLFSQQPFNILKKKVKNSKFGKGIHEILHSKYKRLVYYSLTERGLKIYHRLPYNITHADRKFSFRVFSSIFKTLHPKLLIRRLAIATSLVSLYTLTTIILLLPAIESSPILRQTCAFTSIGLLAFLVVLMFLLYKLFR